MMVQEQRKTKRKLFLTADLVFGSALVVGVIIDYFQPLSFGNLSGTIVLHLIGAPLLLLGGAVIVFAKRELQRYGESSEPGIPTSGIVNSGLYRYSRNPLYAGLTLCFAGLAFGVDMPWLLILLPLTLLVTQILLIYPEERYLEAKFGEEYLHYKRTVRRWF